MRRREEDFSSDTIRAEVKARRPEVQKLLADLRTVELQALAVSSVFTKENYVPVEAVGEVLQTYKADATQLLAVTSFLLGYLTAEGYHSLFDHVLFGEMISALNEDKARPITSALKALLFHADATGQVELPDRRKSGKIDLEKHITRFLREEEKARRQEEAAGSKKRR